MGIASGTTLGLTPRDPTVVVPRIGAKSSRFRAGATIGHWCFCFMLFLSPQVHSEPLFPGPVFDVASGPEDMASGDFNEDGRLDLVTADDGYPYGVTIILGDDTRMFRPQLRFSLGLDGIPDFVAVGDFNDDGHQDIAAAQKLSGALWVLPGLGDGTFDAPKKLQGVASPILLLAEDFDGDGVDDLAVLGIDVSILFGGADPIFLRRARFPAGSGPNSMAAADLDGDGLLDLAVVNNSGAGVTLLHGAQGGTFTVVGSVQAGTQPNSIAISDLDGDGFQDLAIA